MKGNKKSLILSIIGLFVILVVVVGATYAYFQSVNGNRTISNINTTTGTVDSLSFGVLDKDVTINENETSVKDNIIDNDNISNDIIINANESNFNNNAGTSLGDGVTGTAILIAGDDDYKAEGTYNVYLYISKNELQYSSYKKDEPDLENKNVLTYINEEEKSKATAEALEGYSPIPELYLTIKKGDTEIKDGVTINGEDLKYTGSLFGNPDAIDKTAKTLGGFDITEAEGLIKIRVNEPIEVDGDANNHTTTDTWQIIVTYKNLEYNQNLNTGKSLTGKVMIQKEEYIPEYTKTINKLLADANKDTTTLYFHNTDLEGGAEDDSYRYSGSDEEVKNYVCLDGGVTTTGPCGNGDADLYRIIGLFKKESGQYEMKLIKAEPATSEQLGTDGAYHNLYSSLNGINKEYYKGTNWDNLEGYSWNSTDSTHLTYNDNTNVNMWKESDLNIKNLNNYFFNKLNPIYQKMLVSHTWEVGGSKNYDNAKNVYESELGKNKLEKGNNNCYNQGNPTLTRLCNEPNDLLFYANIGIMYLSDYMYATTSINWVMQANNYSSDEVKDNNWLYLGINEWTISRYSSYGAGARFIDYDGVIQTIGNDVYNLYCIRPSFYLSSEVQIKSGDGSYDSPYRLTL